MRANYSRKLSFRMAHKSAWRSGPSTHPTSSKTKTTHSGGLCFWWEWVDSNHLRLKPTDLQSAPALQLRRTPRTFLTDSPSLPFGKSAAFRFAWPQPACRGFAPAKTDGAGSGTRTRTSSLEGLRTSPCTMPAMSVSPLIIS